MVEAMDTIGAEIMARADALGACSEDGPGVTRRFATPEHRAAMDLILDWMRDAGMEAWTDASGNAVGRYEGTTPGLPALIMGSHQDTVRHGGRYDGMLGIITPIACVKALHRAGERLSFAIEIVAFGDEEGLRFQTSLLGSKAVAGTFDFTDLDCVDEDGVTLADAMRRFDLEPGEISGIARQPSDVLAFVEIHIEQGPVLEARDLPVGVVTSIAGSSRRSVSITGTAGHAGTVPMDQRHDALCAAAECILAVERHCAATPDIVGTVGVTEVDPGAINVIPGGVRFTADLRAPDNETRVALVEHMTAQFEDICARRGLQVDIQTIQDSAACRCAGWLMDQLEAAVVGEGIAPYRLMSGAGHDAMALADLTDVGMLFVRCTDGISHNPAEAITEQDAGTGARVLLRFIRDFSPTGPVS